MLTVTTEKVYCADLNQVGSLHLLNWLKSIADFVKWNHSFVWLLLAFSQLTTTPTRTTHQVMLWFDIRSIYPDHLTRWRFSTLSTDFQFFHKLNLNLIVHLFNLFERKVLHDLHPMWLMNQSLIPNMYVHRLWLLVGIQ